VAADLDFHAQVRGAALDHTPGIDPVHRRTRERVGAAHRGAEQGTAVVAGDGGSADIFVEKGFELVMGRHALVHNAGDNPGACGSRNQSQKKNCGRSQRQQPSSRKYASCACSMQRAHSTTRR